MSRTLKSPRTLENCVWLLYSLHIPNVVPSVMCSRCGSGTTGLHRVGEDVLTKQCQQHAVTPRLTNHCCFQKFMPSSVLLIIKLGDLWRKILDQPYGIQYMLGLTSPPLPHGRIHTTLFLPFFSFWYTHVLTMSHPLASASWVLGLEMSAPPLLGSILVTRRKRIAPKLNKKL